MAHVRINTWHRQDQHVSRVTWSRRAATGNRRADRTVSSHPTLALELGQTPLRAGPHLALRQRKSHIGTAAQITLGNSNSSSNTTEHHSSIYSDAQCTRLPRGVYQRCLAHNRDSYNQRRQASD